MQLSNDRIWEILAQIHDPEIPALSLIDMGIIREIGCWEDQVIITITPTFAACPAINVIKQSIHDQLSAAGAKEVEVRTVLSPPWSTDWLTTRGREHLRKFGIAPPPHHDGSPEKFLSYQAACPYCGSLDTEVKNDFGPTLCRTIQYCNHCQQPFESFKPI